MIRGQTSPIPQKTETIIPHVQLDLQIHNRFDIEVIDAKTGEKKQEAKAYNTICNLLWEKLLSKQAFFNQICFGTGSGTPSAADTKLFNWIGYKTATFDSVQIDRNAHVISSKGTIQLSETEFVGQTLTEVGIGQGSTSGNNYLFTHAMLQDMNGNPLSILKSDTDIINIYATIFVHYPPDFDTKHIWVQVAPDVTYTIDRYSSYWVNWVTGHGLGSKDFSLVLWTLSSGNIPTNRFGVTTSQNIETKSFTITAKRVAAGDFNPEQFPHHGIHTVYVGIATSLGNYFGTNPMLICDVGGNWFSGSEIRGEVLGTGDGETKDFATAFELISGCTVYVDGKEASVTVDENAIFHMDSSFLREVDPNSTPEEPVPLVRQPISGYYYEPNNPNYDDGPIVGTYPTVGVPTIWYNPYTKQCPLLQVKSSFLNPAGSTYASFELSDDLENWYPIEYVSGIGWIDVPKEHQNDKFIRTVLLKYSQYSACWIETKWGSIYTDKNIHFENPPAEGSVITANYSSKTIAKDKNHVFDFEVTISFAEKTNL